MMMMLIIIIMLIMMRPLARARLWAATTQAPLSKRCCTTTMARLPQVLLTAPMGQPFDWLRWVAPVEGVRDVSWNGVYRVYAVRWTPYLAPEAVFCHDNNTYSTL